MEKRNGKTVVRRTSVPDGARFSTAEVNEACDRFLRSRGLLRSRRQSIDEDFKLHDAKRKGSKS